MLLVTVFVYSGTLHSPFLFDDYHSVLFNPNIKELGNIPHFFASATATSGKVQNTGGYRPITMATLAIDYALSGLDPYSYHITNIILHLCTIVAVFFLALFFAEKYGRPPGAALIAAGLFALHPVHTNAVTYIIARTGILSTLFYLLSFYLYVKYRDTGRQWKLAASLFLFICGLLSKEIAVTLPITLFLYDYLLEKKRKPRDYAGVAVFFLVGLAYVILRQAIMGSLGRQSIYSSAPGHFLAQPWAFFNYIRLLLFPINLNFYPYIKPPDSFFRARVMLSAAAVLGIFLVTIKFTKEKALSGFLAGWFLVALLPEAVANVRDLFIEYRLYLASVGPIILISLFATDGKGMLWKKAGVWTAVTVIIIFSVLAAKRNAVYGDAISLWEDCVMKSPDSALAHADLGGVYLYANRNAEAAEQLTLAFQLDPALPGQGDNLSNLGLALDLSGQYDKARAVYEEALRRFPTDTKLLINMGYLCLKTGDPDGAYYYTSAALATDPGNISLGVLVEQMKAAAEAKRGASGR